MAQVFTDHANGIVYRNPDGISQNIYIRIEREEGDEDQTRVKYFHYWIFARGEMVKVGSGGYIPCLHPLSERIHEFPMTNFYVPPRKALER